MMLFIPISNVTRSNSEFRSKIIYEKFIGDEALFSIGSFQNLNFIHLKNGKSITIHHLLKSIPALEGMSCPKLFLQTEPNIAAVVTTVTYQAKDHEMVIAIAWPATMESEIWHTIVDGEAHKIFVDEIDRIWFREEMSIEPTKMGKWNTHPNPPSRHLLISHLSFLHNWLKIWISLLLMLS